MSELKNVNKLILILIGGILLTSLAWMPFANAQPTPTSLTLAVPSSPTERECVIVATLKDESSNPLSNMNIDFYFCGTDKIGANKTNSNGTASLKLSDDLPFYPRLKLLETRIAKTWKINAIFSGTTIYAPSGSEYVYIAFVFIDYTPYMVGGGLLAVAIICVAGYIVFRRRRRQSPYK